MNVLIEMEPEHYDILLAQCEIASREFTILKNGIVAADGGGDKRRVIRILCDKEEALTLLEAATQRYPDAVRAIREGLGLSPKR